MNIDLHKIDYTRGLAFFNMMFSMIGAPFLFLFEFQRDLFYSLDILRLMIFAASISFPVCAFNIICSIIVDSVSEVKEVNLTEDKITNNRIASISIGCFFSQFIFYFPSLFTFFWPISFRAGVFISICVEALIFLFMIISYRAAKKEKK